VTILKSTTITLGALIFMAGCSKKDTSDDSEQRAKADVPAGAKKPEAQPAKIDPSAVPDEMLGTWYTTKGDKVRVSPTSVKVELVGTSGAQLGPDLGISKLKVDCGSQSKCKFTGTLQNYDRNRPATGSLSISRGFLSLETDATGDKGDTYIPAATKFLSGDFSKANRSPTQPANGSAASDGQAKPGSGDDVAPPSKSGLVDKPSGASANACSDYVACVCDLSDATSRSNAKSASLKPQDCNQIKLMYGALGTMGDANDTCAQMLSSYKDVLKAMDSLYKLNGVIIPPSCK